MLIFVKYHIIVCRMTLTVLTMSLYSKELNMPAVLAALHAHYTTRKISIFSNVPTFDERHVGRGPGMISKLRGVIPISRFNPILFLAFYHCVSTRFCRMFLTPPCPERGNTQTFVDSAKMAVICPSTICRALCPYRTRVELYKGRVNTE